MSKHHLSPLALFAVISSSATAVSAAVLSYEPSLVSASETTDSSASVSANINVSIGAACTFSSYIKPGEEHIADLAPGGEAEDIGVTTFTTFCNDAKGWSVYAVGYTGDIEGDNTLRHTTTPRYTIPTTTETSSQDSGWSMKLSSPETATDPIIDYAKDYATVPNSPKKVAHFDSASLGGTSFTSTYKASVSILQPAGSYVGKVRYNMIRSTITEADDLTTIHYLQDLTPTICANTAENVSVQLEDSNTGQFYRVTRLADSTCSTEPISEEQPVMTASPAPTFVETYTEPEDLKPLLTETFNPETPAAETPAEEIDPDLALVEQTIKSLSETNPKPLGVSEFVEDAGNNWVAILIATILASASLIIFILSRHASD